MQNGEQRSVKKRRNGIATTRRILDAAAALFALRGFDGVPMRAVAQAAGVRESALYNHFSGKQALLYALYDEFASLAPLGRPTEAELSHLLLTLSPAQVFKAVLCYGEHPAGDTLTNTALIISREKYRSPRAAEVYRRHVVEEPAAYYERLITQMVACGMARPVDARQIAEHYTYVTIMLTHEYIMAQNGLGDTDAVAAKLAENIRFTCGLLQGGAGGGDTCGNG